MLRLFDVILALLGLIIGSPIFFILIAIGLMTNGSPLFFQNRVGREKKIFTLVKLRSMRKEAPNVATHLADTRYVTRFGKFLRNTKLDEFPQLWNVIKGDMSLVGPRPCLPSQDELIVARERYKIFEVRPGITGLAQISRVDMSSPILLSKLDALMIERMNFATYFSYIFLTILGKGSGDPISEYLE